MLTRPLELATKLQPEPRNFDALFFVNIGLIVLFFSLFGSAYVVAPGLGVDFRLPAVNGSSASGRVPTHVISITNSGQIFTGAGLRKIEELGDWLRQQGVGFSAPLLLVRASDGVPVSLMAAVANAARQAGFDSIWAAEEAPARARKPGL